MLMTLRPRCVPNCTAPADSANRVSSLPRPTFTPGWKCVPRWRRMISPALTTWPPKRLTPSRWALESRPFRVDEAPFLCAMSLLLPGLDGSDLDLGVLLAVTLPHPVAGLVLVLQDVDLRGLDLGDDLAGELDALEDPRVGGDQVTIDHEQGLELDGGAGLADDPVDLDDVADGNLVLPAAALDDRVHDLPLPAHG